MITSDAARRDSTDGSLSQWSLRAAVAAAEAVQGMLPLIILLSAWQVLGSHHSPYFPPPSMWIDALVQAAGSGDLLPAVLTTFQSVALALALSTALGAVVGGLLGASPILARCFGPVLEFLRTLPPPTIVPVAALLIGVNDSMKLLVVSFAAFWPVLLNTTSGMRSLSPTLLDAARTLQIGGLAWVTKVILPALLPSVLTGVRVAAPLAIIVSLLAEMLTLMPGLGALLLLAQRNFNAAEVFGLLVVVGLFGFMLNAALAAFEAYILKPQGRARV